MTNYVNDESLNQKPTSFLASDFMGIDISIHLLDIIIKVGRYFPIILLSLASLNMFLAANDFLANSLTFAILNSIFALGNFISLAQIHQRRKSYLTERRSNYSKIRSVLVMDIKN